MNIHPAQRVRDLPEYPQPDQAVRPAAAPISDQLPKPESADTRTQDSPVPVSRQVVKVHSDDSMEPPILVYEFVDSRSDAVVVQIPSEQMLSLVQEIRQRLHAMVEKALREKTPGEK